MGRTAVQKAHEALASNQKELATAKGSTEYIMEIFSTAVMNSLTRVQGSHLLHRPFAVSLFLWLAYCSP